MGRRNGADTALRGGGGGARDGPTLLAAGNREGGTNEKIRNDTVPKFATSEKGTRSGPRRREERGFPKQKPRREQTRRTGAKHLGVEKSDLGEGLGAAAGGGKRVG